MSIGARIRECRIKRGLTQSQLADKLQMTEANISSYERDKSVPPGEKLNQLSAIFGVTADYLLGRSNAPDAFSPTPAWASSKDVRDFKKMLEDDAPIMFDGVPIDEDDKEKIKRVMEAMFWDAKKKNKRKPIDE